MILHTKGYYAECRKEDNYAECYYAECRGAALAPWFYTWFYP